MLFRSVKRIKTISVSLIKSGQNLYSVLPSFFFFTFLIPNLNRILISGQKLIPDSSPSFIPGSEVHFDDSTKPWTAQHFTCQKGLQKWSTDTASFSCSFQSVHSLSEIPSANLLKVLHTKTQKNHLSRLARCKWQHCLSTQRRDSIPQSI